MKNSAIAHIALSGILLILSCSSTVGGTLVGFDKEPVANTLVKLIVVDDEGNTLEDVAFAVTGDDGRFDLGINDSLGAAFIVEAVLPSGNLRGFATGDGSGVDLNPITDAVYRSVIYVTETEGGRSLADFSRKEIREIVRTATKDAELWDIDFNQTQGLIDATINKLGNMIPEAAGGAVGAIPLAGVESPDEITDPAPVFGTDLERDCARDHYWLESSSFGFDILQDGALCKAGSEALGLFSAYGIAYQLRISNDTFVATGNGDFPGDGGVDVPDIAVEDDREVVFGPVLTTKGLEVTRKVYIPEVGDFARYLEVVSNPTAGGITIDIGVTGGIALGEFTVYGTGISTLVDQDEDLIITGSDNYAASISATPDTPHPTVGYGWDGLGGADGADLLNFPPGNGSDTFGYWWQDVTIPSGKTKIFMHYSYLLGTRTYSVVRDLLKSGYESADEAGLSTDELGALQNFQVTRGNITGEAGSVPTYADITVTNVTRDRSSTARARRDGAFSANIGAVSGDSMTVVVELDGVSVNEVDLTVE